MRCVECGEPLISVLERTRKTCAACASGYHFRAAGRPPVVMANPKPDRGSSEAAEVREHGPTGAGERERTA